MVAESLLKSVKRRKHEFQRRHTRRHLSATRTDNPSIIPSVLDMEGAPHAPANRVRSEPPCETTLGGEHNEGASIPSFMFSL